MQEATAKVIDITPREDATVVAVRQEIGSVPATIKVIDAITMELAHTRVEEDDKALKKIHDRLDPSKKKARAVWQDWNDLINELCAPWEADKEAHVKEVKAYQKAEKERAEAEANRLAEEARKQAEDKQIAEAERLEAEGYVEEAAAVIEEPLYVAPVRVVTNTVKVDQRKYRTVWKAEVTDKIAFIIFVADMLKKVPELKKQGRHAEAQVYAEYAQALEASPSWLNKKAVAQGKNLCMAGIRAYEA